MSNAYQQVKKYRVLKSLKKNSSQQQNQNIQSEILEKEDVTCVYNDTGDTGISSEIDYNIYESPISNDISLNSDKSSDCDNHNGVVENDTNSNVNFQEKLRN